MQFENVCQNGGVGCVCVWVFVCVCVCVWGGGGGGGICVVHPDEQYSHGRDSLDGVLFSCILHHVLNCTIYLSRTITRLNMYLVISRGIKYKKIALSLSAFCILCYAGRFIPPRFSSLHSAPC